MDLAPRRGHGGVSAEPRLRAARLRRPANLRERLRTALRAPRACACACRTSVSSLASRSCSRTPASSSSAAASPAAVSPTTSRGSARATSSCSSSTSSRAARPWHAAGLCTQYSGSYNLDELLRRSVDLYRSLEAGRAAYHQYRLRFGSRLTRPPRRVRRSQGSRRPDRRSVRDRLARARARAVPASSTRTGCSPPRLPADRRVDRPGHGRERARRGCAAAGAQHPAPTLTGRHRDGTSTEVGTLETAAGEVRAGTVVIAVGSVVARARPDAARSRLPDRTARAPVRPDGEPVAGAPGTTARSCPVLRDPDESFYVRQDGEGLLVGPVRGGSATRGPSTASRAAGANRLLRPNLPADHGRTSRRRSGGFPLLAEAALGKTINGPDGYTPDGRCLMGPIPGRRDLFVLCGLLASSESSTRAAQAATGRVDRSTASRATACGSSTSGASATTRADTGYVVDRARDSYAHEYAVRTTPRRSARRGGRSRRARSTTA